MAGLAPGVFCDACPDWTEKWFLEQHCNWEAITKLHSVTDNTFFYDSGAIQVYMYPRGTEAGSRGKYFIFALLNL